MVYIGCGYPCGYDCNGACFNQRNLVEGPPEGENQTEKETRIDQPNDDEYKTELRGE